MSPQSFSLQPFASDPPLPSLKINGTLARTARTLAISYELRGPLADLIIPGPAALPTRRPQLWEATCFEFFLALKESPGYWEFNLSPAGHWNVYRFAAYRRGMQEETALATLPFSVHLRSRSLRLALEVDLAKIVPAGRALEVGIAAILQLSDGALTYWALTHPGPRPDFHRRDSFIVQL